MGVDIKATAYSKLNDSPDFNSVLKRIEQVYFMYPKKCENRFQYQKIFLQKYLLEEYLQGGEVYYLAVRYYHSRSLLRKKKRF